MRKRWLVGILAALMLAMLGSAVTKAQKASPKPVLPMSNPQEAQPKRWKSAGDPQIKVADDPASLPPPGRAAEPAIDDPIGAVDSFLQKNQKEAEDSIKALTQEAETLRARLQKVETALSRWQGVAQALDQQAKADGKTSVLLPAVEQKPATLLEAQGATPPPSVSSPPELPPQLEPVPAPPPTTRSSLPPDPGTIPPPK